MSQRNQGIISGIEGTVTIHSDVDATTSAILLNNWTAIIAPTVTDDSALGYAVGSEWTDVTADKSYKLVDATVAAAVWKEITAAGGGGGGNTIYTADDTVLTNRTATVTDTLTWSGGRTVRNGNKMSTIINGVKTIEICELADFPTPIVNVINLEKDTTYLIRGVVDILDNRLDIQVDSVAIVGDDRNKDILKASTLTGVMITVGADVNTLNTNTEYSFTLDNIGLQAPLGKILEASNIDKTVATGTLFGRTKVLQISNCEIRDTKDVWTIVGFELVDLLNNLIWFIDGTIAPIGCQFKSCRHLEIASCEVFNWSNSTAAVSILIELLDDVISTGVGTPSIFNAVVNINGSIIHPEYDQVGLSLNSLSTTKFGTIAANTFINANLNAAGSLFLPEIPILLLPNYSAPESLTYDIFTNQGIINSTSGLCATLQGNVIATTLAATPVQIDAGIGVLPQASNRFTIGNDGTMTYIGTKQIYVSLHASLSVERVTGGEYSFYFYKDSGAGYIELPGSQSFVETTNQVSSTGASLTYGTLLNENDAIQMWISDTGAASAIVTAFQLVIRE